MTSIPQQLLIQVLLIAVNAFFAATEIAVISLKPAKVRRLAEEGDKTAQRLLDMVEQPSGFLSTIQVGITLSGYLGSAFAAENFADRIVASLVEGGSAMDPNTLHTLILIVITLI